MNMMNPFEGSWTEKGQIKTQFESFSWMARYFRIAKRLYYVWDNKIRESQGTQSLFVRNENTLDSNWETVITLCSRI